jgi:hypothetical protein
MILIKGRNEYWHVSTFYWEGPDFFSAETADRQAIALADQLVSLLLSGDFFSRPLELLNYVHLPPD